MKQLKFWRLERGLSQIELSQATGIPRYKIQLAEQGIGALSPEEQDTISSVLMPLKSDNDCEIRRKEASDYDTL